MRSCAPPVMTTSAPDTRAVGSTMMEEFSGGGGTQGGRFFLRLLGPMQGPGDSEPGGSSGLVGALVQLELCSGHKQAGYRHTLLKNRVPEADLSKALRASAEASADRSRTSR